MTMKPIKTSTAIRIRNHGLRLPLKQYEDTRVLDIAAEQNELIERLNQLDIELLLLGEENVASN